MANRPIFIPNLEGALLVKTINVDFQWHPGLAPSQKQRSIESLHTAASHFKDISQILEVSSKSKDQLGIELSAFNLPLKTDSHPKGISVECAFQGSKVFEDGGPYKDIYEMQSRDAKRDERLQNSGRLIEFFFEETSWSLEPRTSFYDWLYITALLQNPGIAERLRGYSAFTDIEFNPERSINCQAYSLALFISLMHRYKLRPSEFDKSYFLNLVANSPVSNSHQDESVQHNLF